MKFPLLVVCFGLLAVGLASAQIVPPVTLTMDTPFVVGNTTLPAGSYEIHPTGDLDILEIRGATGSPAVMFEVVPIDSITPFKKTEVVFNKYGNNLVLKSIMIAGETTGSTSITSHVERRHAKTFGKPTKVSRPAMKKK